jgi:hypothetical protein
MAFVTERQRLPIVGFLAQSPRAEVSGFDLSRMFAARHTGELAEVTQVGCVFDWLLLAVETLAVDREDKAHLRCSFPMTSVSAESFRSRSEDNCSLPIEAARGIVLARFAAGLGTGERHGLAGAAFGF